MPSVLTGYGVMGLLAGVEERHVMRVDWNWTRAMSGVHIGLSYL